MYECKKLFNGFASIRDTTIKKCIRENEDLVIVHDGDMMLIPLKQLKDPDKYQIHRTRFKSKFIQGQYYELYDFVFKPGANLQLRQAKLL